MPELTADLDREIATDAPFSRVVALTELLSPTPDLGRYLGTIDKIWTIGDKVHGGTMVAARAAAPSRPAPISSVRPIPVRSNTR
jgi:hypothetical protein